MEIFNLLSVKQAGVGTPEDAYAYVRDVAKADFFAVTDHSDYFDNEKDYKNSVKWNALKNAANRFNENGKFVAIAGYEMTWDERNVKKVGHINTFNTDGFLSANDKTITLDAFYRKISENNDAILQWNHPSSYMGTFNNFGYYSKEFNKAVKLMEIGNGEGKPGKSNYLNCLSYYNTALSKGWHVAPTINQDNHDSNWVTANDCRTAILATELTRESILDAIRNLRVYATQEKNLKISYKINDSIMGTTIKKPEVLNFSIECEDPDNKDLISKIEIIGEGKTKQYSNFKSNKVEWNLELTPESKYYYVKVTMKNGNYALTSPIWVE